MGASAQEKEKSEPGPDRTRWQTAGLVAKRAGQVLAVLAVLGVVSVVLIVRHYESDLPSVAELKKGYQPPQVTRVYARDGTLLANVFTQRRTVVALKDVPDHAKLAFLAAEDASFYEHEGLDYFGMLRALAANLRAGRTVQGGSTITQQVIKNVLLKPERSYRRKIRETILARRVEQHLSKDQIFAMYLNHIYLGHGRYGVEEASRYYFGKRAKELDLAEASLLAGLVAAPERYSPRHDMDKALARRKYVLGQMVDKRFVTQALHDEAMEAPVRLAPAVEAESELAPEVVDHVKKTLAEAVGDRAKLGGYEVTTTIDPAMQAAARKAVRDNLDRYSKRQKLAPQFTLKKRRLWGKPFEGTPRAHKIYVGTVLATDDSAGTIDVRVGAATGRVFLAQEERYNPKRLPPSEFVAEGASLRVLVLAEPSEGKTVPLRLELGPQAALVAMDPRTREVLALIGSYEALAGGLDRSMHARRQPGSAFKPFVYSYALHSRRFTPASVIELAGKKSESKKDQAGPYRVPVRTALAKSDNAAAVFVFKESGPANVVQWAQAVGIESKLEPNESLALGAYEVSPLEITNAYATFASGGEFASPRLVTKIVGPDGKEVPLPAKPPQRRVMPEDEAYLITSLMRSVVEEGTGRRARALGRPIAGKTGTTNQAKDAWFVGYSTEIVAGVWVGYDDALPLGWGEQGSATALPAFVDFMKAAHQRRPVTEFPRPGNVVVVRVDPATGLLAYDGQEDSIDEEFLDGTAPTDVSSPDAGALSDAGAADEIDASSAPPAEAPDAGAPHLPVANAADAAAAPAPPVPEPPLF